MNSVDGISRFMWVTVSRRRRLWSSMPWRVLVLMAVLAGAGCGLPVRGAASTDKLELFPDPVVAKGKGFEIRRSELDDAVMSLRATLATQNQSFPDREREAVAARLLDRMVATRILLDKATDEDKKKAREAADKFVNFSKNVLTSKPSWKLSLRAN